MFLVSVFVRKCMKYVQDATSILIVVICVRILLDCSETVPSESSRQSLQLPLTLTSRYSVSEIFVSNYDAAVV